MANSKDVFEDLVRKINIPESKAEIEAMAMLIVGNIARISRTDILSGKQINVPAEHILDDIVARLHQQEPLQYILGEADFYGRKFRVDSSVLIPRPETEQLADEVIKSVRDAGLPKPSILDVGTGSGCIAITLAKEFPDARVTAMDVSEHALTVARSNAALHQAEIRFLHHSVLMPDLPVPEAGIIVSNPPYIPPSEKKQMQENVLRFEPEIALFVPEDDPLIFYKALARLAVSILTPGGKLFVEINERFGEDVQGIFAGYGLRDPCLLRDINGKDRIAVASKE